MRRGEKGFTLLEVVVGVAIMGIIAWPLAMAVMTILTNPERSTDHNIVLQQVQNAGYWVSRDVQVAKMVTPGANNGFPVTLVVPVDDNPANDYSIVYLFDDSKLKRQEYDSTPTLVSETLIADYVDTDNTTFSALAAGSYQLTVRAAKGETAIRRSYEVSQRLVPD